MALVAFPNIVTPLGSYVATAPDLGADLGANDIEDGADSSTFQVTDCELLFVSNSTVGSINLLLTTVADSRGRVTSPNPLSIAIPAGDARIFGPFRREGWAGTGNLVTMQASAVGLRAAVIRFNSVS